MRTYKRELIEQILLNEGKNPEDHISESLTRDIQVVDWYKHGFTKDMTFDEAVERKDQLNAQSRLDDSIQTKAKIDARLKKDDLISSAYLPPLLVEEFEKRLEKDSYEDFDDFSKSKTISHWRACKKVIREIEVDLKDWEDEKKIIYKAFQNHRWSVSYCEKLIYILNKWGKFCSKKRNEYYSPIPLPTSVEKQKIAEEFRKKGHRSKKSASLTIKILNKAKDTLVNNYYRPGLSEVKVKGMAAAFYNWIFISFWFGLRPEEVDSLSKENKDIMWKIGTQKGHKVLHVYQTKLVGMAEEDRWKIIPIIFDEQEEAIKLIRSEKFQRPSVKVIKAYLGEKFTTYAGRKGFEDFLLDSGFPYPAISAWMGHESVDRTWRSYRAREKVIIPNNLVKILEDLEFIHKRKFKTKLVK